ENGNTIEIDAPENSSENRYVGKMAIDGKVSERPFLSYSTLLEGAKVRFEMESEK
ncbi:MAG: glycoside hydrolase domain-containing protein, partial [Alistipes shahii]